MGNPSQDWLRLRISSEEMLENYQIQVIALDGKIVYQEGKRSGSLREEQVEVSIHHLASGPYFIRCSNKGAIIQQKWMKQ
ncbi:MAG: T9SS type A sorting domain-containing protein [Saprospiraceae bacterium]|nr:T9SS type A sorting domain-containing protein [Saprospiraceae bacterium]